MNSCTVNLILGITALSVLAVLVIQITIFLNTLKKILNSKMNLDMGKAVTNYVELATEKVIRIQKETEKLEDIKKPDRNSKIPIGQVKDTSISKMENMLADVLREEGIDQNNYNLRAIIMGKINELENKKML